MVWLPGITPLKKMKSFYPREHVLITPQMEIFDEVPPPSMQEFWLSWCWASYVCNYYCCLWLQWFWHIQKAMFSSRILSLFLRISPFPLPRSPLNLWQEIVEYSHPIMAEYSTETYFLHLISYGLISLLLSTEKDLS